MAGNRYRDYVRRSFSWYAYAIMLVLSILIALFLIINVYWFSYRANRQNNIKLAEMLDEQVEQYQKGLETFSQDEWILKALTQGASEQITEANRLLYDFSNSQPIRCAFVLTDAESNVMCSNLFEGNREIFLESTVYQSLVEKMQEEPEQTFFSPSRLNYSYGQTGDLLVGQSILDGEQVCGYLFFDMFDDEIYEKVREYPLDDVILTDRYDNLIFTIGRQRDDPMEKYPTGKFRMELQSENQIIVNGKHYHVHKGILSDSALVLYTLVSLEFQRSMLKFGLFFLATVWLLLTLMLKPLVDRVTKKNLYAIDELQRSVEAMGKGNMDYHLRAQVFDEFQSLNDAFRNMVIQREELLRHNSELTERKRVMEIKQLEEQFNPHFVFNVLETLRYEIVVDASKASDMVMAFANLMRYSIYYGNMIVPLQTDIEYINDYLLLQKMRYNRRLTYHIEIPEEYMNCRIPKLVLQPVVENSLRHGMKDVENINIQITAKEENGRLELSVVDNGTGITAGKLEALKVGLEREDVYREHIGLYNCHRVVRLLYGSDYGVKIDSIPGKGTKVSITLPMDMGDAS